MRGLIDITLPMHSEMVFWPDSVGLHLTYIKRLEAGDDCNLSRLDCDVHSGTHIDAPRHFLIDGAAIENLPLDAMIGPCFVGYLPKVSIITADDLAGLKIPSGTVRLLLRTANSRFRSVDAKRFQRDFVALAADAADWIVKNKIRLIGIDYLSVQPYGGNPDTHKILLKAGIVVLEGLNLSVVKSGCYELVCLPIKLVGAEGAPAAAPGGDDHRAEAVDGKEEPDDEPEPGHEGAEAHAGPVLREAKPSAAATEREEDRVPSPPRVVQSQRRAPAKTTIANVGTNEIETSVFVNLRQGPAPSAAVIRVVAKGTKLRVLARKGRWVQVTEPATSEKGWIYMGNANPPRTTKASAPLEPAQDTQPKSDFVWPTLGGVLASQ